MKRPRVRALKLAVKVRERLTESLGEPVKVIMFGSQARGDATKEKMQQYSFLPPYKNVKKDGTTRDIRLQNIKVKTANKAGILIP